MDTERRIEHFRVPVTVVTVRSSRTTTNSLVRPMQIGLPTF